jgi:hypothetical protein
MANAAGDRAVLSDRGTGANPRPQFPLERRAREVILDQIADTSGFAGQILSTSNSPLKILKLSIHKAMRVATVYRHSA